MTNTVLINGTGTIGEPLISLLLEIKDKVGIDEVIFYKHTARLTDRPMITHLVKRGAKMCVEDGRESEFVKIGLTPDYNFSDALKKATVVVDATSEGVGMKNKELYYRKHEDTIKGFLAQGSESDFGIIYASGINDEIFTRGEIPKYVQIASCNTHAAAAAIKYFGYKNGEKFIEHGDLTFIRRASDISQASGVPAPEVSKFDSDVFGTHHAKDVNRIFKTLKDDVEVFSSALKINTQYMHSLSAHIRFNKEISKDEILKIIEETPQLGITYKTKLNQVFSFGRDHGFFGRILNQSIIVAPSIMTSGNHLYFWSFTPQDGNSLLSSVKATLFYLYEDPEKVTELMKYTEPWVFDEV
jgi:glyceraldehyde-3-phosphate dehydrogenase type II